jgi:hypothetical protein
MLKNRFFVAFAFAGLLGFAACADDEPEVIEEPVVEEPVVEPMTEPAPITTDTALMPLDTTETDTIDM